MNGFTTKNGLFLRSLKFGLLALGSVALLLQATETASAQGKAKAKAPQAAPAATAITVTPEALGAQAFLEELLVRRYSQELSTRVEKASFSLGAQLELTEAPKPAEAKPAAPAAEDDTPADFLLGTIDPDAILARYAGPEEREQMRAFLGNYRIKTVSISIGLKEKVGPEVKTQVETWLKERLKNEFGQAGKGAVSFVKPEPIAPKTPLELLNDFQNLAGQIVLALAVILGLMLWSRGNKGAEASAGAGAGAGGGAGGGSADGKSENESKDESKVDETSSVTTDEFAPIPAAREIQQIGKKITEVLPQLKNQLEPLVRNWCVSGDEGKLRLACFAEAVGTGVGKLPVPADSISEVGKIFARMPELSLAEKRDQLRKAYWDLLKAVNLGAETLEEPFGYLGGMNIDLLNEVMMDQNTKMKTLVTFHMPANLRESYLKSMDSEVKRGLILEAANLTQIAASELKQTDGSLRTKLSAGGPKDIVKLPSALEKVVSALSPIEEATLLSSMDGPAFETYKRTQASLAFLAQWPEDKLQALLSEAMPQQIVALARVRDDLKERLLAACPPMTSRIAADELSQDDKLKDPEKNALLSQLLERMSGMMERKEIDLTEVFGAKGADATDQKAA